MSTLVASAVGTGPHITVMLHGFLGTGRNLRTLAHRWLERDPSRTFLLPDLLGHGEAPALPATASHDELARAILEQIAPLTSEPVSFVGHSLGGRVSLAAVRVDASRVRDVVLLDIAPSATNPEGTESKRVIDALMRAPDEVSQRQEFRAFLLGEGLSEPLTDWLLMNVRREGEGFGWRFDRAALRDLHDRFHRDDLWSVLENKTVPIRCIRGALSGYVNESDAQRMRQLGCRVDTLPRAGHFVHVDALEPLLDLLAGPS